MNTQTTNAEGHYDFSELPSLGVDESYNVSFYNIEENPQYLWSWFGNQIDSYQAGQIVSGGDFDVADIVLSSPVDGAEITLPTQFCWEPRTTTTDNYVWVIYSLDKDQTAKTDYLGYVPCINITSIPSDWPSGAEYIWWLQVYQGEDPDSMPLNYGDSYGGRLVTIHHATASHITSMPELSLDNARGRRLKP